VRRAIVAIVSTAAGTVVLLGAKGALGFADEPDTKPKTTANRSATPSTSAPASPVPNQPAATPTKAATSSNGGGNSGGGNSGGGSGGNNQPAPPPPAAMRMKDGSYLGRDVSAGPHGDVQLRIQVKSGKMTTITIVKQPNESGQSARLTSDAFRKMTAEALQEQSAEVDIVSGATESCEAYIESLQSAIDAAYLA
jgi:uncharacterized protein with FMN-binding domain